jgi:hypothetical protein
MSKLDLAAISEYSNSYSQKICNEFFQNKDTISGAEILNISAIDQVNLFAIKSLYENWKTTTEQFKSPYFDFSNEKVKTALRDFMNVASQHIAVNKADFQPLLAKATIEALSVSLNPQMYFDGIFRDLPEFKCTKTDLATLLKYNRINSKILNGIADKMGNDEFVFTNQALNWLEEISAEIKLDDSDIVIEALNQVVVCEKNMFLKGGKAAHEVEVNQEGTSFFDRIGTPENTKIEIAAEPKVEQAKLETKNSTKLEEVPATLNDTYQTNNPTYNDHLKVADSPTLVDIHQNAPIKSLAGAISLNQKFVFINKLFNGDSAAYAETIEILEKCKNSKEAIELLKYKYAPKYHWNLNGDEADELIDILNRML